MFPGMDNPCDQCWIGSLVSLCPPLLSLRLSANQRANQQDNQPASKLARQPISVACAREPDGILLMVTWLLATFSRLAANRPSQPSGTISQHSRTLQQTVWKCSINCCSPSGALARPCGMFFQSAGTALCIQCVWSAFSLGPAAVVIGSTSVRLLSSQG